MIFIEGTTFKTRFPIFLFSKYGYKPIGSTVEIVNGWQEIYLCSYVRKRGYNFIKRIMNVKMNEKIADRVLKNKINFAIL